MLKFIVKFVFIGTVLCQDSEPDATCNPQPIVNYHFGPSNVPPASMLISNNQTNIAQGRPGRIGPRGFLGPKGEKVYFLRMRGKRTEESSISKYRNCTGWPINKCTFIARKCYKITFY